MNLYPITLGIARSESPNRAGQKKSGAGSKPGSSSSDASLALGKYIPVELRNKILERDNNTCRFCDFQASKYQSIHHLDHNIHNLDEDNLATACMFCHQCFNLDQVGDMGSGSLIWLPEIEQFELHHIARAIYVARISQGPIADAARSAYESILSRREEALNRIETDDPYILATVLQDYLSPAHYKARHQKLDGIRLFPRDKRLVKEADLSFNQFPQILAYWRSKNGPFGGKTPPQWIGLYQNMVKQSAA